MATYTAQHKASIKPAAKLKRTVIVEDVTPKPAPTLSESIHDDVKNLYAKYKVEVPSTTRFIVSCVAMVTIGFGIGYVGAILVETLVIASLMLTGSLFIGMAMYVLGVLATLYTSWKVGNFVNSFIMSGDIDRCYVKYSDKVLNFFSFNNKEVTS